MKNFFYLLLVFVLISFTSCRKVIDLKVNDTDPKLVIEANYDATNEIVNVNITKTINVFSADTFPTITGAIIEIIDENGVSSYLSDNGDGTYSLENYAPIFNSTYKMRVNVEGKVYEAEDFLPEVVEMDSLSYEYQEASIFSKEGYLVFMHGTDPAGVRNYYRLIRMINGEYNVKVNEQLLFDDEFADGTSIKLTLYGSIFEYEDTVQVELISYSKFSYKYFADWLNTAGGGEFSAAPANPPTNWTGGECLGHFSTWGYDVDSLIIGH